MKIAIAGMTHLGVCTSVAAAQRGLEVVCFDTDQSRVDSLSKGHFDPAEPQIGDALRSQALSLTWTDDLSHLSSCEIVLIAIDTVLNPDGSNDDSEVKRLALLADSVVPEDTPLVIMSQVEPGFTRSLSTRRTAYYLMETLVFGRGLERALHPERFTVGSPTPEAELPIPLKLYLEQSGCPVIVMSLESAELSKLAANYVLAANLTASNALAAIAEKIGASWTDVEGSLRLDERIGAKAYISAGPGIGGTNIPRDVLGIRRIAGEQGVSSYLSDAMLLESEVARSWVLERVQAVMSRSQVSTLAILGIAYKPGTMVTIGGVGLLLVEELSNVIRIVTYDPDGASLPREFLSRIEVAADEKAALSSAEVVVLGNSHPVLVDLLHRHLLQNVEVHVIDPFRSLDLSDVPRPERIVQFGVGGR